MSSPRFAGRRIYRMVSPDRIESGAGTVNQVPKIMDRLRAERIVLATSKSLVSKTPYIELLERLLPDIKVTVFAECRQHSPETDIDRLASVISSKNSDAVLSIGGSSVFDAVKVATSRVADQNGKEPIPQVAIPTTLSAGEFTPGAGYTEASTNAKKLVLDPRVAPSCVILDPEVTHHTPLDLWLATGIKALDHAFEAIWSKRPHPYVDALALEAIRLLVQNLPLSREKDNLDARAACQLGAWMSIAGVGASGMRLSHFLGHQIGAHMHLPHGITSCILLPAVMRHLRDETLDAQCRIADAMDLETRGLTPAEAADLAADNLQDFIRELDLPTTISEAGGTLADIDTVARSSFEAATLLGLTADLPSGESSVRDVLMKAWV